jgi:hypothetical protein
VTKSTDIFVGFDKKELLLMGNTFFLELGVGLAKAVYTEDSANDAFA